MAPFEHETRAQQERWRRLACDEVGTLLFETNGQNEPGTSYLFRHPKRILVADDAASLATLLGALEAALEAGEHVAGLLRYEAGYTFERIRNRPSRSEPLAWFGVYGPPELAVFPAWPASSDPSMLAEPLCVEMEMGKADYRRQVARAQAYIAAGDTYQVNFTTAVGASVSADILALYAALAAQQPAPYTALLHLPGEEFILSFSPELFFKVDPEHDGARTISVRPMKGTASLGGSTAANEMQAHWLGTDEKNRAEHVMIVDLLRNDLGRLCEPGSVRVDDLFRVESYRSLLQMTSTIKGGLRAKRGLGDILRALFPSGSMTGAPKSRTMEVLAELEGKPRGAYSGTIGFAAPDGSASFNVAIRSAVLHAGVLRMGVGGGVVADSVGEEEHAEAWLKSEFLLRASPPFQLLETMLWDGSFWLLEDHLERLEASADRLHFRFDRPSVRAELLAFGKELREHRRVRVLLGGDGRVSLEDLPFAPWKARLQAKMAPRPVQSTDSFLRHKTTFRPVYDDASRAATAEGLDEVLFVNERDELTEGAISSLLVLLDGAWQTPALVCGVLPGVARSRLLRHGSVNEAVIRSADLRRAHAVCLCNGVRGIGVLRALTLQDGEVLLFEPGEARPKLR